jgi:hypothetical protein
MTELKPCGEFTILNGKALEFPSPLRLDLGCGKNKRADGTWWGVDRLMLPGVDQVLNLLQPWPWADDSVDEANLSHFVEHFHMSEERPDRIHIMNELWRVLKPKAKAQIVVPHWCSSRAYGDYSHVWPPVSEFWPLYLDRKWRESQVPHCVLYTCDFILVASAYSLRPDAASWNQERQAYAMANFKEVCADYIFHLEKRSDG